MGESRNLTDPVRGELTVEAGGKRWTLYGGTREMSKLEALLEVVGFDKIMECAESCSVEQLWRIAEILLERGYRPEDDHEARRTSAVALLDALSVRGFRVACFRLAAAAYGGPEGLLEFDRVHRLTRAAREAELRDAEAVGLPKAVA